MKKLIASFLGCCLLAATAYAANIDHFLPGFRTIDGNQLNLLVDQLNGQKAGEVALDGSNPTAVTTGLTSITSCKVSLKLATAPGVGTSVITYNTSGGTLNIYAWKVTSSADNTLIASTGTETVGWSCVGS